MKTVRNLLLLGAIATFAGSNASAQTIYYDDFTSGSSGVSIEGVPPTVANDFAGGTSAAVWNVVTNNLSAEAYMYTDGTLGRIGNSVLLPFTPQPGYFYTLSASLTFTGEPGNWLAMGYAAHNPPDSATPRFNDTAVNGNPWSLFRPGTGNGGVQLWHSRNGAVGTKVLIPTTFPNTNTISLVLDTTGSHWVISEYANGVQVTTNYTYSSNPGIVAVGLGQNTTATSANYRWNYLSLAAAAIGFVQPPVSADVGLGAAFTNTVVAVGSGTLFYQWFSDNVPISGATDASLIINPVTLSSAGTNYYVVVTNTYGSVTSAPVSLTVFTNPVLLAQSPITHTNPITLFGGGNVGGTNYVGSTPTFSVSVLGGEPLAYQWLTNSVADGWSNQCEPYVHQLPIEQSEQFRLYRVQ